MPILTGEEILSEIPVSLQPNEVEHVAIIGGGASGAISLDSLLQESPSNFKNIDIFERRNQLGGVWVFDENIGKSVTSIAKSGNTNYDLDPQLPNPFYEKNTNDKYIITPSVTQERFEQTASYQTITTNIPEKLMTYSDNKQWNLPKDVEDRRFVNGSVVKEYINDYFKKNLKDPRVSLNLSTTVEDVVKVPKYKLGPQNLDYRFRLTLRQKLNDREDIWWQQDYDSIIVATGHYHIPQIPKVPGLSEIEKIPNLIHHGKFFRNADPYKDKTVVVVGSRASGLDIVNALSTTASNVYQSKRSTYNLPNSTKGNIHTKPVIKSYEIIPQGGFKVIFEDDTSITNPDHIIYATGYLFSYPYLNKLTNHLLIDNGIISNLYQHTFLINEPLITFVGIPIDGISFRVFEYQAILVSRYLAGKIELPSQSQQVSWSKNRLNEKGYTRAYHTIGFEEALNYLNTLTELGSITNEKLNRGRQFPIITSEDLQEHTKAKEALKLKWGG